MNWLITQDPVLLAFLATMGTWFFTALGALSVCFFKGGGKFTAAMLGFAAGIMIAASFWSLLAPAIEFASGGVLPPYVTVAGGFIIGAFFIVGSDMLMTKRQKRAQIANDKMRRVKLLTVSITLHNIPEGLAVGVAFGSLGLSAAPQLHQILAAFSVAFGIALQNFPEGAAVSLPLCAEGISKKKSFFIGQLSAVVEPIAGVLGAALVILARPILPLALAFAAGAMIFVVVQEIIPEARSEGQGYTAALWCIAGFAVMMIMDVALG